MQWWEPPKSNHQISTQPDTKFSNDFQCSIHSHLNGSRQGGLVKGILDDAIMEIIGVLSFFANKGFSMKYLVNERGGGDAGLSLSIIWFIVLLSSSFNFFFTFWAELFCCCCDFFVWKKSVKIKVKSKQGTVNRHFDQRKEAGKYGLTGIFWTDTFSAAQEMTSMNDF